MTPLNIRLVSLTLLKLFHSKDGDLLIIQFYFILNLIFFISIILCLILLISTETTSMLHIID